MHSTLCMKIGNTSQFCHHFEINSGTHWNFFSPLYEFVSSCDYSCDWIWSASLQSIGAALLSLRCVQALRSARGDDAEIRHWGILSLQWSTEGIKGVLSHLKKGLLSSSPRPCTWHQAVPLLKIRPNLDSCLRLYLPVSRLWAAEQAVPIQSKLTTLSWMKGGNKLDAFLCIVCIIRFLFKIEKVNHQHAVWFQRTLRIQVIDFCKVKVGVIQLHVNKDMQWEPNPPSENNANETYIFWKTGWERHQQRRFLWVFVQTPYYHPCISCVCLDTINNHQGNNCQQKYIFYQVTIHIYQMA